MLGWPLLEHHLMPWPPFFSPPGHRMHPTTSISWGGKKGLKHVTSTYNIYEGPYTYQTFPGGSDSTNPPAMWETWIQSLGWEDPLEEDMATHSSILAWKIPMDRGSWQVRVHRIAKIWTRLSDQAQCSVCLPRTVHGRGWDVNRGIEFTPHGM